MQDLLWLKETGLFIQIQKHHDEGEIHLMGICGGYQMMFENIVDDAYIEVDRPTSIEGLGFIDDIIIFQKEKILKKDIYKYEIHHGSSTKYPSQYKSEKIYGTFSHGLFIDEWFENYSREKVDAFVELMLGYLDRQKILEGVTS